MSTYEIDVTTTPYEIEIGNTGGVLSASLAKAGRTTFQLGNDTVSVSFVTAISATADFELIVAIRNTADSFPQFLTVMVTQYTTNGPRRRLIKA